MDAGKPKALTPDDITKINSILAKDQRVELIPTREGVKVFHVRREEIRRRY